MHSAAASHTSTSRRSIRRLGVATLACAAASGIVAAPIAQAREVDPSIRSSLAKRVGSGQSGARAMAPTTGVSAAGRPGVVTVPDSCSTLTTVVKADRSLWYGLVVGGKTALVSGGVTLSFTPRSITYVSSVSSRTKVVRHFIANDSSGKLFHVSVAERPTADGAVSYGLREQMVASRTWQGIRSMTSNYPYLYALASNGSFLRYSMSGTGTNDWTVGGTKVLAASKWGSVKTLSRGAMWDLGPDARGVKQYAEDLVVLTSTGEVRSYIIPRTYNGPIASFSLRPAGWASAFAHVSVGGCATGPSRPLSLVTASGEVQVFLDKNGDDQNGSDFRWASTTAAGWAGLLAD